MVKEGLTPWQNSNIFVGGDGSLTERQGARIFIKNMTELRIDSGRRYYQ